MNSCSCCFTDTLAKCETEIKLNIILPVYGSYRWVITDKFGNKYQGDLNAEQTIPVDELPAGLLTQYNGSLTLQIFEQGETCGPVKFLAASKYECIDFSITPGNFEKNNLGCDIEGEASNQPLVFVAMIIQSGTNDPVVDNLIANTIGPIAWVRSGVGTYIGNLIGAFPFAKTAGNSGVVPGAGSWTFVRLSDDAVGLFSYDMIGNLADTILQDSVVRLEVYP